MSRPPYPHRCIGAPSDGTDFFDWTCQCGALPDIYGTAAARDGWGSGCPTALREALAEAEAERDAALAEALRLRDLVRHQRGPLHDAELITDEEYATLASDAGSVARLRGYDELRRESRADVDKAVAAAMEVRAKELDARAEAAIEASDKAEAKGDHYRANSDAGRWAAFQAAARIVRGT